jgi:hypothetical protein
MFCKHLLGKWSIGRISKDRNLYFSKYQNYSKIVQEIKTQVFQKVEIIPKLFNRSKRKFLKGQKSKKDLK